MPRGVTYSVTVVKPVMWPGWPSAPPLYWGIVTGMVTRIHKHVPRRLYLRENRKAKGLSAETVAGRMDMERESLLRLEREPRRCNSEKQAQYAAAIQVEPEDLWRPPGRPSLDGMVQSAPVDVQQMAFDIVQRLIRRAG